MKLPQRDTLILGALILFTICVIYFRSQNDATEQAPISTSTQRTTAEPNPRPPTAQSETETRPIEDVSIATTPPTQTPAPLVSSKTEADRNDAINDFRNLASIDIELPFEIPFQDLGIESPDMMGIYGKTKDMAMAVVAKMGTPSNEEIVQFIRSQDTGIPNLDVGIQIDRQPKIVPAAEGTGMKAGNLWTGKLINGDQVHVAVIPRADGQGIYMIVLSGEEAALDSHDDFFEDAYRSMRARETGP
jgi:hypothetical protein